MDVHHGLPHILHTHQLHGQSADERELAHCPSVLLLQRTFRITVPFAYRPKAILVIFQITNTPAVSSTQGNNILQISTTTKNMNLNKQTALYERLPFVIIMINTCVLLPKSLIAVLFQFRSPSTLFLCLFQAIPVNAVIFLILA